MADQESTEAEGKKKKPIVLIIVLLNIVLAAGAGAFMFLRGGNEPPPVEGEGAAEGGDDPGAAGKPKRTQAATARTQGILISFQPIVVNLNEPEGARYLKIQLVVELSNDNLQDLVEQAKPVVRDHFIRELSDLNFRQTMGNKSKLAIKRRLIKKFNESIGAEAALDIHITQFIVQ